MSTSCGALRMGLILLVGRLTFKTMENVDSCEHIMRCAELMRRVRAQVPSSLLPSILANSILHDDFLASLDLCRYVTVVSIIARNTSISSRSSNHVLAVLLLSRSTHLIRLNGESPEITPARRTSLDFLLRVVGKVKILTHAGLIKLITLPSTCSWSALGAGMTV
jgi:hypothetical protein